MPRPELDFPFAGGIDEKTQSLILEPGSASVVRNLRQLKNGSYQKRNGNVALGVTDQTGATIPVGKRLIGYRDELVQTDGLKLWSLSSANGTWKNRPGMAPQLGVSTSAVLPMPSAGSVGIVAYDSAYVNGYYVVVYSCAVSITGNIYYEIFGAVFDATNGSLVVSPKCLTPSTVVGFSTTAPWLSLVVVGTRAVLVYSVDRTTDTNLWVSRIDTSSPAALNTGWSTPNADVTDCVTPGLAGSPHTFDACGLGNNYAIVYTCAIGGDPTAGLKIRTFTGPGVAQTTAYITSTNTNGGSVPNRVSVSGNASNVAFVAFAYNAGTLLKVAALDPVALTQIAAPSSIYDVSATGGGTSITNINLTWTGTNAGVVVGSSNEAVHTRFHNFTLSGASITVGNGSGIAAHGLSAQSRPFVANGRVYCAVAPNYLTSESPDSRQLLVVDMTQTFADSGTSSFVYGFTRVVANPSPRLALLRQGATNVLAAHASVVSSTKAVIVVPTVRSDSSAALTLVTLDWAASNVSQPVSFGDVLVLGGGAVSTYDGVRCSEVGFFQRPLIASLSTSGGAGILNGVYKYVAVYEQIDGKGQVHRSNVSDPFTTGTLVNNTITPVVNTLIATNRMDSGNQLETAGPVRIVMYRTMANQNVYFRVPGSEVIVSPANNFMTQTMLVDNTVDTALGAPLYTQPGIPNTARVRVNPPPFSCDVRHLDRVVGASDRTVWPSGSLVSGEGPWFADEFQFDVGDESPITALASFEGSLVIFKRNAIFFVDGQGPVDNSSSNDFSPPQAIPTDVGCIEPRSVVVTPQGVIFQSLRGIELLTRSRTVDNFFGQRIQDTLAANPVITSAVLDEAKGLVVFTATPVGAASGVELVWDYVNKIWTVDNAVVSSAPLSAVLWGRQLGTVPIRSWLSSTGGVFQESVTDYRDNVLGALTYVQGQIVTPWIKMAGLQGYGRINGLSVLASCPTPCDIQIQIEVDYRAGQIVQTRTFLASEIATFRIPQLYVTLKVQKCESMRVTITDLTPTGAAVGTGQGPVFIGLRLEYRTKEGINRPTAAGR